MATTKKANNKSKRANEKSKPQSKAKSQPKATGSAENVPHADLPTASRYENFAKLAQRRSEGDIVMLPSMLRGNARRRHVRQTLREDHTQRIYKHHTGAKAKFAKLCGSLYSFFRGTCLLFYRDMAGEDAWMPTVLALGDVHPENFGVMPSSDNTPIFGVNDFDEAYYAPFTWDLKRGAVGFLIAAKEQGLKKKFGRKAAKALVKGYLDGIKEFAKNDSERDVQVRIDNAPKLIRELLEETQRNREEWLENYLGPKREYFIASDEVVPLTGRIEEFQKIMTKYREDSVSALPARAGNLVVKDVAEKKDSGTASLGLPRYYILIKGPTADGTDDLILEMKQARRSALAGLAPPSQYQEDSEAGRVVNAQAVHLVGGDPFYGKAELNGQSFLVRERSPYKTEIDLEDLSKDEWCEYARICGRSLAQAHALADDSGAVKGNVEARILDSVGIRKLFVCDILNFADEMARRINKDHIAFVEDYKLGAFKTIDFVYD
ncbi:MAG: DUF2252 domain-containing protein [Nitrosomonas sp.]|nr:DUF2252 domain-containing protein [Nitrosomonas sp.]